MSNRKQTLRIVLMAIFVALSIVGSLVKLSGTIALDSMPAFLAASLLGPLYGAIIGFIGHLATALTSGFPLSIVVHLIIAVVMFIVAYVYGWIIKKAILGSFANYTIAAIAAVVLNGVGAPAVLMLLPAFGMEFFAAMLMPLVLGSAVNVVLAVILQQTLGRIRSVKQLVSEINQ